LGFIVCSVRGWEFLGGKRGTLVLFVVSEAGSSWDTIHNPGE